MLTLARACQSVAPAAAPAHHQDVLARAPPQHTRAAPARHTRGPAACAIYTSSRLRQLVPPEPAEEAPSVDAGADALLLCDSTQVAANATAACGVREPQHHVANSVPAATAEAAAPTSTMSAGAGWTASADADVQQAVRAQHAAAMGAQPLALQWRQQGASAAAAAAAAAAVVVAMPDSSWRHQQHTAHGAMPQQQQPRDAAPQLAAWSLQDGDSSSTSTTTTSSSSSSTAGGTFFASRAAMLQRLQLGQLQQQRQHLLALHSRPLYRYALGEGGSSIVRQRKPSSRRASQQRSFARAQQQPQQPVPDASAYQTHQQPPPPLPPPPQQQQQQQQRQAASAQPYAVSLEALQQQELQGARRQQQQQALDGSSQPATQPPAAAAAPPPAPHGPSRGVSLAVFVYCCSATQLLALAWDLGLSPTALRIVPRLEDADAVVHVKPAAGEKHYQYDEFRAKAAARGIPFVDLKALSALELQMYLLPVYRLYAGELSPRDLAVGGSRRRGRQRRGPTNLKLAPA